MQRVYLFSQTIVRGQAAPMPSYWRYWRRPPVGPESHERAGCAPEPEENPHDLAARGLILVR
jgi:hypothetical protein